MSLLGVLLAAVVTSFALTSTVPRLRRRDAVLQVQAPAEASAEVAAAWKGARARTWLLYVSVPAALALTLNLGSELAPDNGLRAALVPLGTAAVACLVAAWPRRRVQSDATVKSASLLARPASRFGARWVLALPLGVLAALCATLVLTGLSSSTDPSDGRWRSLAHATRSGVVWNADGTVVHSIDVSTGAAGPYPGWYYGLPLMVGTAVVAALLMLALYVNASAPAWQGKGAEKLDAPARAAVARTASLLVSVCALIVLGGVSAMAAVSWWSSSTESALSVGDRVSVPYFSPTRHEPWAVAVAVGFYLVVFASTVLGGCLSAILASTLKVFGADVRCGGERVTGAIINASNGSDSAGGTDSPQQASSTAAGSMGGTSGA